LHEKPELVKRNQLSKAFFPPAFVDGLAVFVNLDDQVA
jgi:hypothetical protein